MGFLNIFNSDYLLYGERYNSSKAVEYMKDINMKVPRWYLGSKPDIARITKDLAKIEWQSSRMDNGTINNKYLIRGFVIFYIFWAIFDIWLTFRFLPSAETFIFILLLPFLSLAGLNNKKRAVEIDLIKYNVAKSKGWTYDPTPSDDEANLLSKLNPDFFDRGNTSKSITVDDQLWGAYSYKGVTCNFYSGVYTYVVGSGKTQETRVVNFFALKLNKKIDYSFTLIPESRIFSLKKRFSGKELNLESIDFNKKFAFAYRFSREQVAPIATRCLSPVVQNLLVDLEKRYNYLSVCFVDDAIIFGTEGRKFNPGNKPANRHDKKNLLEYQSKRYDDFIFELNKVATEVANRL